MADITVAEIFHTDNSPKFTFDESVRPVLWDVLHRMGACSVRFRTMGEAEYAELVTTPEAADLTRGLDLPDKEPSHD